MGAENIYLAVANERERQRWTELPPGFDQHTLDTVHGSEIRRSPVEVGSLSVFLIIYQGFYTSKRWLL